MKRRCIAFVVLAVILLGLLGTGYTFYWRYVAAELEKGIAAWAESERAAGRIANFSLGGITGFPFSFRRDFADVELGQPVADGLLRLEAGQLTATMRPWNLQVIAVKSGRPFHIELLSATQGTASLSMAAGEGAVRLRSDGRLERIDLRGREAAYDAAGRVYAAETVAIAVDLPPLTPRTHQDPLIGFDLSLGSLTLPEGERALTTAPIATAAIAGTILGPIAAGQPARAALAQWARDGGTVELKRFAFAQAPLDLEGEGTLALDRDLQVLGALTIRARGLAETIDLLAGEGLIAPNIAATGRMMAQGLVKTDDKGNEAAHVPLSLQQGFAWLGPIRLAPLPRLTW